MKIMYKGEETEVEETEVVKAVKEEYEKKEAALQQQPADEKIAKEDELKHLREEHAKQLRVIMTTGKLDERSEEEKQEEEEKKTIDEAIKRIVKKLQ